MGNSHIQSLLKKLPNTPGVYKLKDEEGRILYVGKAKNLKKRVQSYFRKQKNRPVRTKKLIEKTADIEWIEVESDLEALFLETNLIKEFRPKYNVLMKDDKNYVYIKITKDEDFPRIKIVRKLERDKARYFGPKTAVNKVKKTLMLLQKLFLFRSCDLGMEWKSGDVKVTKKTIAYPCLDYHIKRCSAPCIGKIDSKDYKKSIEKIESFLEGKTKEIEDSLKKQMTEHVANKDFEKAAVLRDKLMAIQDLMQKQIVTSTDKDNMDVFAFVLDGGKAYFNLFMLRDGKLINQENFIADAPGFESGDEENAPEVMESFLFQYYEKATDIPKEILSPIDIDEKELLLSWLKNQVGSKVSFRIPERAKKKKLLELAKKNADSFKKQHRARWAGFEKKDEEAVKDLAKVLKLKKDPKRIECFDVSHLGGTDTVASMVVFENGVPKGGDYRKFTIRSLEKGKVDDYKAIREVMSRRLAYLEKVPKSVTIRKATKTKVKAIEALLKEWRGEPEMHGEIGEYYLATVDKKLVGLIRMIPYPNKIYLLRSLYVTPKHRNKGVGKALIRYSISKLKPKRVYLACLQENQSFYESFGFDLIKSFPKEFDSHLSQLNEKMVYFAYDPSKYKDLSFESKPNLIVIDGGKGQLNAALKVRDDFGLDIPMLGLAKREEDIYLPKKSAPLLLPKESKALQLLQRIRDEAHRFAISFQKGKRKAHLTASSLDHVKGLGDVGKMKLLQYFGSVEKIKAASEEEISEVVGPSIAKKILQFLDEPSTKKTKNRK